MVSCFDAIRIQRRSSATGQVDLCVGSMGISLPLNIWSVLELRMVTFAHPSFVNLMSLRRNLQSSFGRRIVRSPSATTAASRIYFHRLQPFGLFFTHFRSPLISNGSRGVPGSLFSAALFAAPFAARRTRSVIVVVGIIVSL
jgi:hypothetical protein